MFVVLFVAKTVRKVYSDKIKTTAPKDGGVNSVCNFPFSVVENILYRKFYISSMPSKRGKGECEGDKRALRRKNAESRSMMNICKSR